MTLLCPNCRETLAEPAMYEGDLFVAVECPVCGVRGPIRPLMDKSRFEQVGKLAMEDWRQLFGPRKAEYQFSVTHEPLTEERINQLVGSFLGPPTKSNETSDTGEDVTPSSKQPAVDTPEKAVTPPQPGEGGGGGLTSNAAKGAAAALPVKGQPRHIEPVEPVSTGEAGTLQPVSATQRKVVTRVRDFLAIRQISAESAGQKKLLGTTAPTLYKLLSGKPVSEATLINITNALDAHERKGKPPAKEKAKPITRVVDGVPIEELPNSFQDATGVNRCPAPTAPPRCGKTP